jgi:hypothetical protein
MLFLLRQNCEAQVQSQAKAHATLLAQALQDQEEVLGRKLAKIVKERDDAIKATTDRLNATVTAFEETQNQLISQVCLPCVLSCLIA